MRMVRPGPGPMPGGSRFEPQAIPESMRSEYRAALLSVFANTHRGGAEMARFLPPTMRPMPLRDALRSISRISPEKDSKAVRIASKRLMSTAARATDAGMQRELRSCSRSLLGDTDEEALWTRVSRKASPMRAALFLDEQAPSEPGVFEAQARGGISFDPLSANAELLKQDVTRMARRGPQNLPSRAEMESLILAVKEQEEALSSSYLNLDSLVTTVTVSTSSTLDFERICWLSDPRTWSAQSAFWVASQQVELVKGRFVPVENPDYGSSWNGHLYEFAEWNWNTASISAVQNYLNIDFRQHRWTQDGDELGLVWMGFSLYACQGSMMLTRLASNGVDVDRGFLAVLYLHPKGAPEPMAVALVQKNVRFSDTLTRRTSHQGLAGAGQTMSYMAPAVVGLWMHEGFSASFSNSGSENAVQSTAALSTGDEGLRRAR